MHICADMWVQFISFNFSLFVIFCVTALTNIRFYFRLYNIFGIIWITLDVSRCHTLLLRRLTGLVFLFFFLWKILQFKPFQFNIFLSKKFYVLFCSYSFNARISKIIICMRLLSCLNTNIKAVHLVRNIRSRYYNLSTNWYDEWLRNIIISWMIFVRMPFPETLPIWHKLNNTS